MEDKWSHSESWTKRGDGFCVEVKRWESKKIRFSPSGMESYFEGISNKWNVYAHIFESHPYFKRFDGEDVFQDAASALYLHCGPTFLEKTKIGYKVGSDYAHLYDDHFEDIGTRDRAYEVFHDAEELFNQLQSMTGKESNRTLG